MGDVVRINSLRIYLNVTGESCIDYVRCCQERPDTGTHERPVDSGCTEGDTVRCKVKVDFGWNREERYVHWQGKLSVNKGRIVNVTPCFRVPPSPLLRRAKPNSRHMSTASSP